MKRTHTENKKLNTTLTTTKASPFKTTFLIGEKVESVPMDISATTTETVNESVSLTPFISNPHVSFFGVMTYERLTCEVFTLVENEKSVTKHN